jgi:hypothetical protein
MTHNGKIFVFERKLQQKKKKKHGNEELWTKSGSIMLTPTYHYLSKQSHQMASLSYTWGKVS